MLADAAARRDVREPSASRTAPGSCSTRRPGATTAPTSSTTSTSGRSPTQLPDDTSCSSAATRARSSGGHDLHGARLIDVTSYPDIAELMLIADVLVTDYSSVMFDFAATGKPMVFYTPDLAHYGDVLRGFYFDLVADAPGPVVETRDRPARRPARGRRRRGEVRGDASRVARTVHAVRRRRGRRAGRAPDLRRGLAGLTRRRCARVSTVSPRAGAHPVRNPAPHA